MNFGFFEAMTRTDALRFLEGYLRDGSSVVANLIEAASAEGVEADFTLGSIVPVFELVARHAVTSPVAPDPEVPEWIRSSPGFTQGLYVLDEDTQHAVLSLGYYLGEVFVRSFGLSWGIGDQDVAEENQPVVGRFRGGLQLAVILVAENLTRGLIEGDGPNRISRAVDTWASMVE